MNLLIFQNLYKFANFFSHFWNFFEFLKNECNVRNLRILKVFLYTEKKSWFKQIHFVDEKISCFNKMSFVTTKPMQNKQKFSFLSK